MAVTFLANSLFTLPDKVLCPATLLCLNSVKVFSGAKPYFDGFATVHDSLPFRKIFFKAPRKKRTMIQSVWKHSKTSMVYESRPPRVTSCLTPNMPAGVDNQDHLRIVYS